MRRKFDTKCPFFKIHRINFSGCLPFNGSASNKLMTGFGSLASWIGVPDNLFNTDCKLEPRRQIVPCT